MEQQAGKCDILKCIRYIFNSLSTVGLWGDVGLKYGFDSSVFLLPPGVI